MSDEKNPLPIDPKELAPAGAGLFVGLLILALFVGIAFVMGLPLLVEKYNIPMQ